MVIIESNGRLEYPVLGRFGKINWNITAGKCLVRAIVKVITSDLQMAKRDIKGRIIVFQSVKLHSSSSSS